MSYEVYIDVRHHPRHLDDWERTTSTAGKFAEPEGTDPPDADRMRTVVAALRGFADELDPDVRCSNCGELRSAHSGFPQRSLRCFGRYGPYAQHSWWTDA